MGFCQVRLAVATHTDRNSEWSDALAKGRDAEKAREGNPAPNVLLVGLCFVFLSIEK